MKGFFDKSIKGPKMMGEFKKIAEQLSMEMDKSRDRGGIRADEIPEIITNATGQKNINCYPGQLGYNCYEISFFISICSPAYVKGRGHMNCRTAIERIVQHMQGVCPHKTNCAVFITDSWDALAWEDWKANLEQIKRQAHIEIYLLSGRNVSGINF